MEAQVGLMFDVSLWIEKRLRIRLRELDVIAK
jgi:hypothetical protein